MVINLDSSNRTFDAQLALEGAHQDAHREANAPMEDGIPAGDPSNVKGVMAEALLGVAAAPSSLTRLTSVGPRRLRMHDRLLLRMYVPP